MALSSMRPTPDMTAAKGIPKAAKAGLYGRPTVGLVLCPDKNDPVVKYTLGEQQGRNIFASRYQQHLPAEQRLQQELKRELRQLLPEPTTKVAPAKKKLRERKR